MAGTKIIRHVKIKGEHHIFDGQDEYWIKRIYMNMTSKKTRKETCLIKQKFRCNVCKEIFKHDSIMELDHIIPKSCGGTESVKNLHVLHRHCHDTKTRNDGSYDKTLHKV
jgi:RNA-directed DNA polymerase